jgi:ABC-type sulfate/molybdate transport systems ATPase subunit
MRQRVAICRALIYDPDILLMDEPFSALDAITRDEMNDALLDIWQRHTKTALFVTHSIREAVLLADRVLVMTNRPSTIIEDVTIPFVRPRTNEISETPEFMQICSYLRSLIEQGHGRRRQNPDTRATPRKRVVRGPVDEGTPSFEDRRLPIATAVACVLWQIIVMANGIRIHSASAIRRRAHARASLPNPAHASVSGTEAVAAFLLTTLLGFVAPQYSLTRRCCGYFHPDRRFNSSPRWLAPLFVWLGTESASRIAFATFLNFFPS